MRMFAQKLMNRALPGGVENISFRGNFNSPRALIRETKIKRSKKTRSIGGRNYTKNYLKILINIRLRFIRFIN